MSEKVSIQESGKSRSFSGVGVIETETPDGESCFWVLESERELETEYAVKNGTYRPQKYGFSDIHVNVFDLTTDLDGNNWKIDIGDIDMPDISLPDFDIDLTIDPSTGLPDISVDGVKIDLPDLSGYLDLDAGFDVSLDVGDVGVSIDDMSLDLIGVDLNGDDIKVDIDLGDMGVDVESCPKSIYVLSRPASLVYNDGDTIDFTGLSIAALDKDGMDWPDPSTFTPISPSMISIPTTKADTDDAVGELATVNGDIPVYCIPSGTPTGRTGKTYNRPTTEFYEVWDSNQKVVGGFICINKSPNGNYYYKASIPGAIAPTVSRYNSDGGFAGLSWPDATLFGSLPVPVSSKPITGEDEIKTMEVGECIVPITVQWTSPCMETLEATFDITVYPKHDHDGSHHSGKF